MRIGNGWRREVIEKKRMRLLILLLFLSLLVCGAFLAVRVSFFGESAVRETLAEAILRSRELVEESNGYSYVCTRIYYENGKETSRETIEVRFADVEEGRAMDYLYLPEQIRTVYFPDRGYISGEDGMELLSQTPEECQDVMESWSGLSMLEFDADGERIEEWHKSFRELTVVTYVSYEGGATRWHYAVDPKERLVLEVRGEDFDEDGAQYALMTISFIYDKPEIDLSFMDRMEE